MMNYATTTDFAPIRLTMDADSGDVVIDHYDYDLDLWYHFETLETDGIDSCYATHEELLVELCESMYRVSPWSMRVADFIQQPCGDFVFERSPEDARNMLITQIECRAIRRMLDRGETISAQVRATRLWNLIDHSNRPRDMWRMMTDSIPEVFELPTDSNSLKFVYSN
jgi:hypothetical protein